MLAEVVDAVVGGDTHRDTHALELTAPSGATIATLMIGNDERGFAEAIAWVAEHAPGPRVVVGLEGTRSYGIGLARVLQAAGLTVVEIEHPRRGERRRGKSDRSTPTWPRCTRCAWTPTGCPRRAPTVTVRRYAFCSALAGNSPQPRLGRSIACAHCCSPAATPTERCPAAR